MAPLGGHSPPALIAPRPGTRQSGTAAMPWSREMTHVSWPQAAGSPATLSTPSPELRRLLSCPGRKPPCVDSRPLLGRSRLLSVCLTSLPAPLRCCAVERNFKSYKPPGSGKVPAQGGTSGGCPQAGNFLSQTYPGTERDSVEPGPGGNAGVVPRRTGMASLVSSSLSHTLP